MENPLNKTNGNGDGNGSHKTKDPREIVLSELSSFIDLKEEKPGTQAPSDGNNGVFKKNPYQISSPEWELGWTDGRYGQPKATHLDIISADARIKVKTDIDKAKEEIADKKSRRAFLSEQIDNLRPTLEKQRDLFDMVTEKRIENRQEYSGPLALIMFVAALGLFIADIPLTINLVSEGFGLNEWGVISLATGLTLLGIFVKLFLDKIIFSESELKIGPEKRSAKTSGGFRFYLNKTLIVATFLIVMSLYVYMLSELGFYREDQLNVSERARIAREVDEMISAQDEGGGLKGKRPEDIENLKKALKTEKLDEAKTFRSEEAPWVFFLLTVLFPIVGGFCFSVGSRNWYKVRGYYEIKKDFEKTRDDLDSAIIESEKINDFLHDKEKELQEKLNNATESEEMAMLRRSIYLHGYERGSKMMQTLDEGENLYQRCETLVRSRFAELSRKSLWRDNK